MKKFFAFFLALVLACSLAVPVLAVDITVSGTATGYSAYRIFDLSQGVKPGHSDDGECPVENCDKANDPGSHWNYAYSVNEKYIQVLSAVFADLGMDDIEESDLIAAIQEFDGDATRIFADGLYKRVRDLAPEYASGSNTFAGVDPGYYLIAETGTAGPGDSTSLVMLDTAGLDEVHVTSKESAPTLEKKIGTSDSVITGARSWFRYTLESKLPAFDVLRQYDTYRLVFHDDISDGLRISGAWEVRCYVLFDGVFVNNCVVEPSQVLIRDDSDSMLDDTCELEIVFDNIKEIPVIAEKLAGVRPLVDGEFYEGEPIIRIEYYCELTDDAVVGYGGNPNTAHLEFSNNPYDETSMGKTPEDKVTAFTFGLHINKLGGDKMPLSGAEFSLYEQEYDGYWVDGDWDDEMGEYGYWDDETGEWIACEEYWVDETWREPVVVGPIAGSDNTQFEIRNLDTGKYKLVETKVPDGYQKADDIIFEIVAESERESDDPKLTKLDVLDEDGNSMTQGENAVFSADLSTGLITTNVVNYAGAKLPSTGGSGVYGIYMTGVVMALAGMGVVMVYGVMDRKKKEAR